MDIDQKPVIRKLPSTAWKPGQSGNPYSGSTPYHVVKIKREAQEKLAALSLQAVEILQEMMVHEDPKIRCYAMKEAFDRGLGKPIQQLELKSDNQDPSTMSGKELIEAMEKYLKDKNDISST